jgi:molybdate transport system substrate-binding protein
LKEPLEAVLKIYKSGHGSIVFNYGASGALAQQIKRGAPIDFFISADSTQIQKLDEDGLIVPGSRRDLLSNKLVLVTPASSSFDGVGALTNGVKSLVIGEPRSVPVGKYAQEALKYFGFEKALSGRAIFAADATQVLTYVAQGNVDAGIVYSSDALKNKKVHVAFAFPDQSHSPIVYSICITEHSKNRLAAKAFEDFLFQKEAQDIFKSFGFVLIAEPKKEL